MKCTFQYYCQKFSSTSLIKQKCTSQSKKKKNTTNKKTAFRLHEQAHTFIHIKSIFNISDGRICPLSSSVLRHRHSCTHDTGIQDDPSPTATQDRFPEAPLIYGANFAVMLGSLGFVVRLRAVVYTVGHCVWLSVLSVDSIFLSSTY